MNLFYFIITLIFIFKSHVEHSHYGSCRLYCDLPVLYIHTTVISGAGNRCRAATV
jgi:hypothetical protein